MGLTRVRHEETIFQETLDHFAAYCDAGIVVYDDCSNDSTYEIARAHPAVKAALRGGHWSLDRLWEEWRQKQLVLDAGREFNPKWFLYFDADERVEFDMQAARGCDAVVMRLFDAYITPKDITFWHLRDCSWPGPVDYPIPCRGCPGNFEVCERGTQRRWFGPEYREIAMLYRNEPRFRYYLPDQRIVAGIRAPFFSGYVRHYGKAVSVKEWEDTCDYYIAHFPMYRDKWAARKGKAVHRESDFGRPLMEWDEKDEKGICIGSLPSYALENPRGAVCAESRP